MMKRTWIIVLLSLTAFACAAQSEQRAAAPEKIQTEDRTTAGIVDAQLAAYNQHDLDALLHFFHPDIESFKFPGERQLQGLKSLRETFANQFNHQPREVVVERIVEKNHVIDKVEVTIVVEGQTMTHHGTVIYTIEDNLIRTMMFL